MGGRGGSSSFSGKSTGLDVTHNGETTRYYFEQHDGVNYYSKGVSGIAEPTPLNMSVKEFRQRAEANGATVKTVSASERVNDEKNYKAYRKEMDTFLNAQDVKNRVMSKESKALAKGRRAARRGNARRKAND